MARLTTEQKEAFIRDGFLILPGFVDQDLVDRALKRVDDAFEGGSYNLKGPNKWGSNKPNPGFWKNVRTASEITDLVYETGLIEVAEQLLGEGNVTIRDGEGQVAYTEPSEVFIEEGTPIDKQHLKKRYHIDAGHGKYAALGSDFSFLMGVALSEGQELDENRGQFTVWPGSHYETHKVLRKVIKTTPPDDVLQEFKNSKPDVGQPVRALLRQGDAMIAHQRLAHAPGMNLSQVTRKNIYFRVVHRMHDDLVREQMMSPTPWIGFFGLQDLLRDGATGVDSHGE